MRCLMLKVITEFRNIFFHRTARNLDDVIDWLLPNKILGRATVSQLTFFNVSSLKKIVHNDTCFQKVK